MPRLLSRPMLAAMPIVVLLATSAAGAGATARPALTALRGSTLPALRTAARVARVAGSQPVDVTVSLTPRNPALLAYDAGRHGRPMAPSQLRAQFGPSAATRASVVHYMRSQGFMLEQSGLLTLGFHGTASAATRAFHVGLSTYRSAQGEVFRAPDGAVQLPSSIAPAVAAVSGLDTQLRLHRMTTTPKLHPSTVTPSCSGPGQAQANYGGYLPADLAQAYGHGALINAGDDGGNESIAMVELSNYKSSDITSFQSCFGLSGIQLHNHAIRGGTNDTGGAIEDELDIEVAMSNAPGLHSVEVYIAPNNLSNVLPMLEQMVSDVSTTHAYIISDSWGLCEARLPPSFMEAEATDLELAAAAGISFYAASGDSGSSACKALVKTDTRLVVDDPASQPFATGVGGTTLHDSFSGGDASAWKDGGGGISSIWPQPAYQSGNPVRSYDDGSKCGNGSGLCRQVPDIALDANLNTGYIMKCTASSCPPVPWFPAGGTSAGAPLMAAITADANEYSLAHGGGRMGFANPLLYSDPAMFWDITSGNNSVNGSGLYAAVAGYDPATGLGSPKAGTLETDLAAFAAPAVSQDATQLAITGPTRDRTITYGKTVTFTGTLKDSGAAPIAGRRVFLELREGRFIYLYHDQTDGSGVWSIALRKALRRNLTWNVIFAGSDTEAGVKKIGHAVRVIPRLSSRAATGSAPRGSSFTFAGVSAPGMHGVSVQLQVRRSKSGSWHTVASVGVSRSGGYKRSISFSTSGAAYLRWHYSGGKTHPWMSATSPVRRVSIT